MTLSQDAKAPASEVVLEAVGLTKHFPVRRGLRDLFSKNKQAVHAVDDVTITLRRGQVTALVGMLALGTWLLVSGLRRRRATGGASGTVRVVLGSLVLAFVVLGTLGNLAQQT